FIVADEITEDSVWWGDINVKFDSDKFDMLFDKVMEYLGDKEIFIKDAFACSLPEYRLSVRVVTESAFQNLFAHNLFLRPLLDELIEFEPEWHVIAAPGFQADPEVD